MDWNSPMGGLAQAYLVLVRSLAKSGQLDPNAFGSEMTECGTALANDPNAALAYETYGKIMGAVMAGIGLQADLAGHPTNRPH